MLVRTNLVAARPDNDEGYPTAQLPVRCEPRVCDNRASIAEAVCYGNYMQTLIPPMLDAL